MTHAHKEIEVRFLEVDVSALTARLKELGAEDKGADLLRETIFYDQDLEWNRTAERFVRVRRSKEGVEVTYKRFHYVGVDGAEEVQFNCDNEEMAILFLERVGLRKYRVQEKKRHQYFLDGVMVEFVTWPGVPTLLEIEGESEGMLRYSAEKLGLDWKNVFLEHNRAVIEKYLNTPSGVYPPGGYRIYTFEKME